MGNLDDNIRTHFITTHLQLVFEALRGWAGAAAKGAGTSGNHSANLNLRGHCYIDRGVNSPSVVGRLSRHASMIIST